MRIVARLAAAGLLLVGCQTTDSDVEDSLGPVEDRFELLMDDGFGPTDAACIAVAMEQIGAGMTDIRDVYEHCGLSTPW